MEALGPTSKHLSIAYAAAIAALEKEMDTNPEAESTISALKKLSKDPNSVDPQAKAICKIVTTQFANMKKQPQKKKTTAAINKPSDEISLLIQIILNASAPEEKAT